MTVATYTPQPGTQAFRILAWLEAEGKTAERNSSQIANAMGIDANGVPALLAQALAAHLVFRRQKDRTHPRAPFWYSLTDHGVRQRLFTSKPAEWMEQAPKINRKDAEESGSSPGTPGASGTPEVSSASSAEAAAADAPSGDEGAAADADRAAAPAPDTSEGLASQQVLKAEAAWPDATAREATATGGPGVGPMGAGQPADAGPTTDDQRSGGGGARPAAAGCTGTDGSPLRGPSPGRHSQDAGAAPGPLHHDEQPRQVDEQFARSLRAAMGAGAEDCLARGAELGRRRVAPLAFRAARVSDGRRPVARPGQVIASLTADEVDVLVQLLGART